MKKNVSIGCLFFVVVGFIIYCVVKCVLGLKILKNKYLMFSIMYLELCLKNDWLLLVM